MHIQESGGGGTAGVDCQGGGNAENAEAVDLPCLSRTTPGIILRGIDGQECIAQDRLRRKGASNFHRDFFVSMGVCLFFNCFVMKPCAINIFRNFS